MKYISMPEFYVPMLIGALLSLSSLFIKKDFSKYILAYLHLLCSFLLSILFISIGELSKLNDNYKDIMEFNIKSDDFKQLKLYQDAKKNVENTKSKFVEKAFTKISERYVNTLNSLINSEIAFDARKNDEYGEAKELVRELYKVAVEGDTIRATSFVDLNEWWFNTFGDKYIEYNREAASRNVFIERIFIFKDLEEYNSDKVQSLLSKLDDSGTIVYYGIAKDFGDEFSKDIDFLVINSEMYVQMNIRPQDRTPSDFLLSYSSSNIKSYRNIWNKMKVKSKRYSTK